MAVYNRDGILYLHFSCYLPDKRKVFCRESTGLANTPLNHKIATAKDKAIKYELKHGRFNYLHFFPDGAKSKIFSQASPDITLKEYFPLWMAEKSLAATTETSWHSAYNTHLLPYFGNHPLHKITEQEILVFRKQLEEKGLEPSTINDKIIKLLCMCLGHAKHRGMIVVHPCDQIKRLRENPVDIEPFSFDELNHFFDILQTKKKHQYYDMFYIWSRIGFRPGELCALKWENIDYYNRKIKIRQTRYKKQDTRVKTRNSVRDCDMAQGVLEAFKRQEARTGLQSTYVFLTEAGNPFSEDYLRKVFRHLLRLAGLALRPVKNMRHTFATLSLSAGENISWVSKMLGHSNPDITWKSYNRYIPNLTRQDGSALESAFAGNSNLSQCDKTELNTVKNR